METPIDDDLPTPEVAPTAPPSSLASALDELLRSPRMLFERADGGAPDGSSWRLLTGALACLALYGAAAGFFQGGSQIAIGALKAPLIVLGSLLMCLPSFYVMSSLAGIEVSGRWLRATLLGFVGLLSLLLAALLPISWLFSVSSRSLPFVTFLHLAFWLVAVGFAHRFLQVAFRSRGVSGAPVVWTLLLVLVSLQVASQLRPVLWRPPGMAAFAPEKRFFLEHWVALLGDEGRVAQEEAGDR